MGIPTGRKKLNSNIRAPDSRCMLLTWFALSEINVSKRGVFNVRTYVHRVLGGEHKK